MKRIISAFFFLLMFIPASAFAGFNDHYITFIGDGMLADAQAGLSYYFPNMYLDAQRGRKMNEATSVVSKVEQQGDLGDIVVVSFGTSEPLYITAHAEEFIKAIGPGRWVFWINNFCPNRNFWKNNNDYLLSLEARYANFVVVDWNFLIANNPSLHEAWLNRDGLTPAYAGTVMMGWLTKYYITGCVPDL